MKNTTPETMTIRVTEEHHIAQARQAAKALAQAVGFRQVAVYYVATSVSELANNLYFHTLEGGTLTMRPLRRGPRVGLEVVARDSGPGIEDLEVALQDGYSTNGGLGGGLPGVRRLMDEFEITTSPQGTRIVARKWRPWG